MNDMILLPQNKLSVENQLFKSFLSFVDVKGATSETYTKCVRQFFKWLQAEGISNPARADVIAYRNHLRATRKPSTVQTYMISLKQFYKWLEVEGIAQDITKNIKGATLDRDHKKDYFTSAQIKNILNQEGLSLRDRAIISLAVAGGLRTIEISRANIGDMRPRGENMVLYLRGKGRDEWTDYVEIPEQVETMIRAYLGTRDKKDPSSPLFASRSNRNTEERLTTRSISRLIKGAFQAAGYDSDRLTAHSLRHTTATLNILAGATLEETQEYMRHANITTTMIYMHRVGREKNESSARLAKALF